MAVKQSRACDALFDPVYTVSGARDHIKQQGPAAGFLLQNLGEHANLFSELQHFPASTFRLKLDDRIPAFIDRSFHPHERVPQLLAWQSSRRQVSGAQLFKFVRRPLLGPGASSTSSLQLRLVQQQAPPQAPPPPPEPPVKDAGTQSDYRESEAQTLPWSPGWVLPTDPAVLAKQAALCARFNSPGAEILQLAHLTFGNGLPGGLQEVRRLEQLRAKRAFEASLPPIDDVARLPQRQAMIEAWEVQEWAEREAEIQGVQEERLVLLAQALQAREEEIEAAHREQVQRRSAALLAGKAPKFAAIQNARVKTERQLADTRAKVTQDRRRKSSIIEQYADYGSALYAPPQRLGHFPDAAPAAAASGSSATGQQQQQQRNLTAAMFAPSSIASLNDLEASLPRRTLQPPLRKPPPRTSKATYSQRVQAAAQQDVETIHDMLQAAKAATGARGIGQVWPCPLDDRPAAAAALAAAAAAAATEGRGRGSRHGLRSAGTGSLSAAAAAAAAAAGASGERPSMASRGAGKPVGGVAGSSGPAAPTEAPPLPDADGRHAALVLLQRLLRGRAVQNEMHAGKQTHLPLIRELRLGMEGTGGCQPRPEARDAATQERDAAVGAVLCRLCCLLTSGDEAGIAQALQAAAQHRQQLQQEQPLAAVAECLTAGSHSWSNEQDAAAAAAAQQEGDHEQPPGAQLVAAAEEGDGSTHVAHTGEEQEPDAGLVEGVPLAEVQPGEEEEGQGQKQEQEPEPGVGALDEAVLDQQASCEPEGEQAAGAPGGGGADEAADAGGGGGGGGALEE